VKIGKSKAAQLAGLTSGLFMEGDNILEELLSTVLKTKRKAKARLKTENDPQEIAQLKAVLAELSRQEKVLRANLR